jgi:hypothetical protein
MEHRQTDPVGGWAPDACTLPTSERPLRAAEFGSLFAETVRGVARAEPTRLHLDLQPSPEAAARAAALAAAETECCSFFTFTLTATGGALALDITVPAAHVAVLDALADRCAPSPGRTGASPR